MDGSIVHTSCSSFRGRAAAAGVEWITSRRADQGRDCGAAEIQRIAENAPRRPDLKWKQNCLSEQIGSSAATMPCW
jgi:hypothetical protein